MTPYFIADGGGLESQQRRVSTTKRFFSHPNRSGSTSRSGLSSKASQGQGFESKPALRPKAHRANDQQALGEVADREDAYRRASAINAEHSGLCKIVRDRSCWISEVWGGRQARAEKGIVSEPLEAEDARRYAHTGNMPRADASA